MKTVIMAGGKGTRIAEVASDIPKPMIPICKKPILEYQIEVLKRQGYTDIIIGLGHLGHIIKDYFSDGSSFGVHIEYITEEELLGTAGALFLMKEMLSDEDFLLLNGDIIFDIDIERFYRYHKDHHALATLFTHPNSHPYDSGIIVVNENGQVARWLHKEDERQWYQNRVNAGLHFLNKEILNGFSELQKKDLDRDVLKPLIAGGRLFAYDSPEYVKDMGTPDRLLAVEEDVRYGMVQAKNLAETQKAFFLDRDGTLNVNVGLLTDIEQLELIPGTAEAVRRINQSGYLAILITNQPAIAKGMVSLSELKQIHDKLETLLGNEGAYLDAIYYCPHHPDKGFEGERIEYKIECDCRKPKPGMILKAAKEYHISLSDSYMVGDAERDITSGNAAGCTTVYVGDDMSEATDADMVYPDVVSAVKDILSTRVI